MGLRSWAFGLGAGAKTENLRPALVVNARPHPTISVVVQFSDNSPPLPPEKPLTLVAYSVGAKMSAYVEPTAVGRELIDMPLFLTWDRYVNIPLGATYQAAYSGVPRRWREVLEGPP